MMEAKKDQSKASGSSAKETAKAAPAKAKRSTSTRRAARKPKAAKSTPRPDLVAQSKAVEEVKKIHRENEERAATHERVVVQRQIEGLKGTLDITTADGLTYVNDVVLDQDGLIELRHTLDAAFQAVS